MRTAIIRAARTAVQTLVATLLMFWIDAGELTVSALGDTITAKADFAGGAAILAAASAFGWRKWLDPSPIPSLNDDPADPDA